MRLPVLALAIASVVFTAGGAAAQSVGANGAYMGAPGAPGQDGAVNQSTGGGSEVGSRHERYLMRLHALHEWLLKLKARDGGQLSDEHAAILQRKLDRLNRIYAKG